MSARAIITQGACRKDANKVDTADAILLALKSAGYRILAPGALDRETLEAAAKVADKGVPIGGKDSKVECYSCNHEAIAAAIRALGGGE